MSVLTFLSPILLWGMALAAIPILIHLLYRRRFRRLEWAPMKYLKLTAQRNRRRIQLEQLLLLLMRVCAMLLLFLLLARPVLNATGFASWLTPRGRTSHILVLDDSLSMQVLAGNKTAFERALEWSGQIVHSLDEQARLTVVLTSEPKMPMFREIALAERSSIEEAIRRLAPADVHTVWGNTLEEVARLVETATIRLHEITILTDLRQAGWDDSARQSAKRLENQQVTVRMIDVGTDAAENVAVAELIPRDRVALVGVPTRWEAVIRNPGTRAWSGGDANFLIDGRPSVVSVPPVGANETVRVSVQATFQTPGDHHLAFQLPGDVLLNDDVRWASVRVRENLNMLVIDGEPSSEPFGGEADFLALALSVGVGEADAWRVEVISDTEWLAGIPGQPDLVVLANVARPTSQNARDLDRRVREGMGVMFFMGDQVDVDAYNQLFHQKGAGILPAELESAVDDDVSGLLMEKSEPGALTALSQLAPAVLQRITIRRFMSSVPDPGPTPDVRVLARWNNALGSPAVFEKTIGAGKSILWTITADKGWSDWPAAEHSYVLAVRESALAIARSDAPPGLVAGQRLQLPIPRNRSLAAPVIHRMGQDAPIPLKIEAIADSANQLLTFDDTRTSGLYYLSWQEPGSAKTEWIAINPDARESDLARIGPDAIRSMFGSVTIEILSGLGDEGETTPLQGNEIWRPLAMGLYLLLGMESCLAAWAGRQR